MNHRLLAATALMLFTTASAWAQNDERNPGATRAANTSVTDNAANVVPPLSLPTAEQTGQDS